MQPFVIAPSILSADSARLGEEVEQVLNEGADWVHFDVMDNHYVPNLTIGPMVCKALRDFSISAPIDVHLMVEPVDALIGMFADAGASVISFHPDASTHVDRSLQLIRDAGCQAGLVFNPASDLAPMKYVMDKIDLVLLMSVNPGFGGQSFIESCVPKVAQLREMIGTREIHIEIDGGVTAQTAPLVAGAGADVLVAGSAVFKGGSVADPAPYGANIRAIRAAAEAA